MTTYSAAHGLKIYGGRVAPSSLPLWAIQAGAAINKLVAIPNSSLNASSDPHVAGCGIVAYGGLTVKRDTNEIFSVINGGHTDSGDNGVYSFGPKGVGLMADSPRWMTRCTPTPNPVGASDPPLMNVVQADGEPTSRHAYDRHHYSVATGRIYVMGGTGLYNAGANSSPIQDRYNIYPYDPVTDSWDATITGIGFDGGTMGYPIAVDHVTGELYTNGSLRFDPVSRTFSNAYNSGTIPAVGMRFPTVVAHNAGYLACIMFGDGWSGGNALNASKIRLSDHTASLLTFNDSPGYQAWLAGGNALTTGMDFDDANGKILWYGGTAGQENRLYFITPRGDNPWDVEPITLAAGSAVMPAQASGPAGLVKYIPGLKGFVIWPMPFSSSAWRDVPLYFLQTA